MSTVNFQLNFNENIKFNVAITEFKGTGKFWHFNNGQYGEKTECKNAMEYRLAYHYGKVYVNSCIRHENRWGSTSMSSQCMLERSNASKEIIKALFEADKKAGIIPEDYILL